MVKNDLYYMEKALKEANKASFIDEVPVGCIIVKDNKIIARAHNLREHRKDITAHAELIAIKKASKKLMDWQLIGCDIYITLEPCLMCAGAIIQSRFKRVIYGAKDFKGGAFGGSIDVLSAQNLNHKPFIVSGVLENECSNILKKYFKQKRTANKENK